MTCRVTLIIDSDLVSSAVCAKVAFLTVEINRAVKALMFEFHDADVKADSDCLCCCSCAMVSDRGEKCGTSCGSTGVGTDAYAAFRDILVEKTSVINLDGAPSLNGFGDLCESFELVVRVE